MSSFLVSPLNPAQNQIYDLIFCSSGSEQRCTHWHKKFKPKANRAVAWAYSRDVDTRAFTNLEYFKKSNFQIIAEGVLTPKETIRELVSTISTIGSTRVAIDISSMTRELMATWISELSTIPSANSIQVDFFYSRAKFSPPPKSNGLAHKPVPVIPEFAGLWHDPQNPLLLILGVGYEPYLATSFCEFLDPSSIAAFIPNGHEERYVDEIAKQNKELFEHLRSRHELLLSYDVSQPIDLYSKLESVVFGRIEKCRVNIAPYGLKTFALCSFLVAARYSPNVMVWHLNPNRPLQITPNRIASGEVNGLSVSFHNTPSSAPSA